VANHSPRPPTTDKEKGNQQTRRKAVCQPATGQVADGVDDAEHGIKHAQIVAADAEALQDGGFKILPQVQQRIDGTSGQQQQAKLEKAQTIAGMQRRRCVKDSA
jgi:hypothetical protein